MGKRKYTQRRRADLRAQTRARIVDATVALHEEVGPERTTVSAIADRAGVERLTVYRHFPDEPSLFSACAARFTEQHPPPEPENWEHLEAPDTRTRAALEALYGYYEDTGSMFEQVYRDAERRPALKAAMEGFEAYLDGIRDDLVRIWKPARSRRRLLRAVVRHALRFSTWQSLRCEGLGNTEAARLLAGWIACEHDSPAPRR